MMGRSQRRVPQQLRETWEMLPKIVVPARLLEDNVSSEISPGRGKGQHSGAGRCVLGPGLFSEILTRCLQGGLRVGTS